jgi:hypothetical protein
VITDAKMQSGLSHVSQILNDKLEVFLVRPGGAARAKKDKGVDDWLSGGR